MYSLPSMIAMNVAINDTRDHWSIIVDLHLAFIESVTTSNVEFADKKKRDLFLSTLPYSYVQTVRNLTRRPEACDAVVKTIRYNRRNCGPIRCLDNSRWVYIYLPAGQFCLSFRAAHVICVRYIRDARLQKKSEGYEAHRQVHEKEKSIPQRKDDWQWTRVTKSHDYVSLRRTVVLRTRCKAVAGYQTWELKRFGMQISLIEEKR